MMRIFFCALSLLFFITAAEAGVRGDFRKGGKFYNSQKYGSALNSYQEILKKYPKNQSALFNTGNAYYRLNEYTQAEDAFKKASQESGEYAQHALFNLGNTYYKAGDMEKAKESYKAAILKDPTDKEAIHNLQLLLQEQQQQQQNDDDSQKNQNQNSGGQGQQDQEDSKGQSQQQNGQEGKLSQEDAQRIMSMAKENEYKKPTGGNNRSGQLVEKDW